MVNKIVHEIILNVTNQKIQETFPLQQNDSRTHRIAMHINQDGKAIDLTGCTAYIRATKPDDTEIYSMCEIKNDIAYYTVTKQFAAVPGYVLCHLEIIGEEDTILYSPKFQAEIYSTSPSTKIESSSEYTAFEQSMGQANELITRAQLAAVSSAEQAAIATEQANTASSAATTAAAAQTAAEKSAANAESCADTAALYAASAKEKAETAATAANEATAAKSSAKSSADTAGLYSSSASSSASSAAQSAANAESYAKAADGYADTAALYAASAGEKAEAAQADAAICTEKAGICEAKAKELANRVINQSDYDSASALAEGVYFVRLGV